MPQSEPWYRKTLVILLFLVFLPPVGIILLWASGKFTRATRVWLTIGSVLLFLVALETSNTPHEQAQTEMTPDTPVAPTSEGASNAAPETGEHSDTKTPPNDAVKTRSAPHDADPPPRVAHRADQVPELLERLRRSPAFTQLRPTAENPDTGLFLTIVSNLLTEGAAPHALMQRARSKKLHEPAVDTYLILSRTGRLPRPVEALANGFLQSLGEDAHQKTWDRDDASYDITALAAWLNRDNPNYLRELLAARRNGPQKWTNYAGTRTAAEPWIPWLALPGAAYERLSRMVELTDAEWTDWCTRLGHEAIEKVDVESGQTRRTCGCTNGLEVSWETMRTAWPLTIPGGCLKCEPKPPLLHVVLDTAERRYAINGAAAANRRNHPIEPIWADDPKNAGFKISIGNLIQPGLSLCKE